MTGSPTIPGRGPLRVTFLTVMPSPYMRDLFAALRAGGRVDPRVYYYEYAAAGTHWDRPELPPNERVLPGVGLPVPGGRAHWNAGLPAALAAPADLHVVGGYVSVTAQRAARRLRRAGRPYVFHGERPGVVDRGGVLSAARFGLMKAVVGGASGLAAVGDAAVDAYRPVAGPGCVAANLPYVCDVAPFLAAGAGRPDRRDRRAGTTFLYCGQLIARKGVDLLVDAFVRVAADLPGARLRLVGAGPLRAVLEDRVPPGLRDRVTFAGFLPLDGLPAEFAAADAFVLPSRHDGWGVVVNQALAAGLPVIATEAVGAAELLSAPDTGAVIPAGSADALTAALRRYAGDLSESVPADPPACRRAGVSVGADAGAEHWADLLETVHHRTNAASPASPGLRRAA